MTTSTSDGALATIRDAMDKALASPRGLALTFLDADNGGREAAEKVARTWQRRCGQARAGMRRINAAASVGGDLDAIPSAVAADPNVVRTAYDTLYTEIHRNEADDGYELRIKRADADEIFQIREL